MLLCVAGWLQSYTNKRIGVLHVVCLRCRYVETTHAPTHIQYKLKIRSVLKIARPSEDAFHDVFQSVGNHTVGAAIAYALLHLFRAVLSSTWGCHVPCFG